MTDEQLGDDVYDKITELCKSGDEYQKNGQYDLAIEKYEDAYRLLPEPKHKWEAATWILVALGETYFFAGEYENARNALQEAMYCPCAIGNPFIHLRLGQVQFELGNLTKAADELVRAYMGEGEEIFSDEEPKYFNYVKTVIRI